MEHEKNKQSNPRLEDLAMKTAAQYFGEVLLPYLNISGKIQCMAPTEMVYLEARQLLQDFNYVMEDGSWSHFEFQSTSTGIRELRRFREYEAVTGRAYEVPIITYVVFRGDIKNPMISLSEGINTYWIQPICLSDRCADDILERVGRKTTEGIQLEPMDLLELMLSPLMSGESSQKERMKQGIQAVKKIEQRVGRTEDVMKANAVLYAFASKFLSENELIEVEEEISMTLLGQMLMEDGMKRGIEVGKAEGKAEGIVALLDELEPVEKDLKDRLFKEKNPQTLTRWLKAAAKSQSIEEFIKVCGISIR